MSPPLHHLVEGTEDATPLVFSNGAHDMGAQAPA